VLDTGFLISLGESYKRLVERFIAGATQVSRTDEEIVKPFKAKLGRLVEKLSEKTIEGDGRLHEPPHLRGALQGDSETASGLASRRR
jgi:hypothetical protein